MKSTPRAGAPPQTTMACRRSHERAEHGGAHGGVDPGGTTLLHLCGAQDTANAADIAVGWRDRIDIVCGHDEDGDFARVGEEPGGLELTATDSRWDYNGFTVPPENAGKIVRDLFSWRGAVYALAEQGSSFVTIHQASGVSPAVESSAIIFVRKVFGSPGYNELVVHRHRGDNGLDWQRLAFAGSIGLGFAR